MYRQEVIVQRQEASGMLPFTARKRSCRARTPREKTRAPPGDSRAAPGRLRPGSPRFVHRQEILMHHQDASEKFSCSSAKPPER